jgi:bifunctional glutamyl/prolyl-tRNA synthetase
VQYFFNYRLLFFYCFRGIVVLKFLYLVKHYFFQDVVDTAVKTLLELKANFKNASGQDWKPGVQVAAAAAPVAAPAADNKSVDSILAGIAAQGDKIRQLKSDKAAKNLIDEEVKSLLSLKAQYKAATGQDWKPPAAPPKSEPAKPQAAAAGASTMADPGSELSEKIAKQGDRVRELKSKSAPKVM